MRFTISQQNALGITVCLIVAIGILATVMHLPISDLVWIQERTITASSPHLEQCIMHAAAEVPGVTMVRISDMDTSDFTLTTDLTGTLASLPIYIVRVPQDTIRIRFAGRGTHESEPERAALTPLFDKLSSAIQRECN